MSEGGGEGESEYVVVEERGIWQKMREAKTGETYFYNEKTDTSRWEEPPSWVWVKNEKTGVWRHRDTGATSRGNPAWEKEFDPAESDFYYHNADTGETQWERPADYVSEGEEEESDDDDGPGVAAAARAVKKPASSASGGKEAAAPSTAAAAATAATAGSAAKTAAPVAATPPVPPPPPAVADASPPPLLPVARASGAQDAAVSATSVPANSRPQSQVSDAAFPLVRDSGASEGRASPLEAAGWSSSSAATAVSVSVAVVPLTEETAEAARLSYMSRFLTPSFLRDEVALCRLASPAEVSRLAELFRVVRLRPGQVLFAEGQTTRAACVVVASGALETRRDARCVGNREGSGVNCV
jgi:hypothetical protein